MQSSSNRGLGLPDKVLTELRRAQIPPEAFAAVLGAFGELPEEGQKELALRVISASEVYRLRKLIEKHLPRRHEHQTRLGSITTSAKRLLALLGIDEAKSVARGVYPPDEGRPPATIHPTATFLLTWLYRVAVERRPATAAISANERLTSLILLLSDLVEATERCALEIATGYKPDRGGKRRAGPTAEVELMQSLMESYAALRNSFPSSGPQPAFDRALKQFVRSCLTLVDPRLADPSQITDAAIRGAFDRSRPNQRGNRV